MALRAVEYAPAPMPTEAAADAAWSAALARAAGAPLADVVSPLGITRDDAEAERLGALGAVEQLECFAVLRGCARAGVPASAVLAVANHVGARARDEWLANREAAEAAARAALRKAL